MRDFGHPRRRRRRRRTLGDGRRQRRRTTTTTTATAAATATTTTTTLRSPEVCKTAHEAYNSFLENSHLHCGGDERRTRASIAFSMIVLFLRRPKGIFWYDGFETGIFYFDSFSRWDYLFPDVTIYYYKTKM